jgi:hypothetical protein
MGEGPEVPTIRSFGDLNIAERVHAVLGAVKEPVSRQLALDFSGVNYDELKDDERKAVDSVFSGEEIVTTHVEDADRYWLNDDAKTKLATSVDMKSVSGQIANKMLGDLGLDF